MQKDQTIISLLDREPEEGMALLIEEYSGLLWTVCRQYLQNTEDVKECVNEIFSEFYLHRERFDPEKGALKGYLAVIARRCAQRRWRENQRWEGAAPQEQEESDPFSRMESKDELEAALAALEPLDEQIVRMKYYGGMTAREIAASLGLPYETVKKRYQRSMKKLLKGLAIGLVVAALLGLLAACTYAVLRHFGFVPGYGVSSASAAVYVLESGTVVSGEQYEFHLEDAYWQEGSFIADLKLYGENNPYQNYLSASLSGLDNVRHISKSHDGQTAADGYSLRVIFEGELPEGVGNTLCLTMTLDGTDIPVTLSAADKSSVEEAGFYAVTESDGGLLAVPRIENGELVVSIHPLNEGEFSTYFFLNQGVWKGYGGPDQPVTVVSPDGAVWKGEPASYNPFSGDTYLDWYFGPAQPGNYTLHIPYVYQYPAADKAPRSAEAILDGDGSGAGTCLSLPGGRLMFGEPAPIFDVTAYCDTVSDMHNTLGYQWWSLETIWEGKDPERFPAAIPAAAEQTGHTVVDGMSCSNTEIKLWTRAAADPDTGSLYTMSPGYVLGAMEGWDSVAFSIQTESVCYRWNHSFSIPMTVPPEEEWEKFTQSAGDYTLTAVPRRVSDQVILSLRPASEKDHLLPSGSIVRSPLTAMGEADEPITLTDTCGRVYMGNFRPGRTDAYSDWDFGDVPAGQYTLHVPYLYTTVRGEHHMDIPLPQEEGQELSVDSLPLDYETTLVLDTITGMGPAENFELSAGAAAITHSNGAISTPENAPLTSILDLSLESGKEEYILVDVGIRLWMTEEASFLGACERQYSFEETGVRFSGLLLHHVPGLYTADFTFVNPTYRWNHTFDIPVTIPE